MLRILLCVVVLILACPATYAEPRTWTSAQGGLELRGEWIGANDTTVILKRQGSGRLAAVELAELSKEDQEYVRKQVAGEATGVDDKDMQTWTSTNGLQIRGRVLAYGKQDYTIGKIRGVTTINGKAFSTMDPLHQRIALRVLSELEEMPIDSEADLSRFMKQLGGQPKTYPLEGVLMQLKSGDEIAVPFFLFSKQDLQVLQPGWESWKQVHESDIERERQDLMMRTEAMHYQQQQAAEAQRQQMEVLKLHMLAARTGLTSIWEVMMQPGPGVYGRPTSVMVTARNSQIATQMVLPNYPGYRLIGVRKASGG